MKFIDVREPGEYAEGHVEGAVNIPLGDIMKRLDEIPKAEEVVVYCRSGGRAGVAVQGLGTMGYINIVNGINQQNVEANYL
jgi:rhodanese-related sulfurtransferase